MREQWFKEYAEKRAAEKIVVDTLLAKDEFLDEDGYPTDDACTIIELWPHEDVEGWFVFINSIWHLKSWGWAEGPAPHEWDERRTVYLYNISTAGWSGNETLIRAMKKNTSLWSFHWVQSRRGGHYIFEREVDE